METKNKKTSNDMEFYSDTMELEKKKDDMLFLNKQKGVFVGEASDGLNRNKNIFDRTALFHVGTGE